MALASGQSVAGTSASPGRHCIRPRVVLVALAGCPRTRCWRQEGAGGCRIAFRLRGGQAGDEREANGLAGEDRCLPSRSFPLSRCGRRPGPLATPTHASRFELRVPSTPQPLDSALPMTAKWRKGTHGEEVRSGKGGFQGRKQYKGVFLVKRGFVTRYIGVPRL